jgi:hypothetical protein
MRHVSAIVFAAAGTSADRDFALMWKEEVAGRKRVYRE